MVDVINNSVNNSVIQRPKVGVIAPPDALPKTNLYSEAEASKNFDSLNRELSWADRKVEYHDKKKNFLGIAVSTGVVVLGMLLFKKKIIEQLSKIKIKNIFKKK